MSFPTAPEADIAFLLEGTFPYVSGGVSSWVNQIIRAYPEYRYALIFLGSRRDDYEEHKYTFPDNVVHYEEHFIYDGIGTGEKPVSRSGDAGAFAKAAELHESFLGSAPIEEALAAFREIAPVMMPGGRLDLEDFLHSERSFDLALIVTFRTRDDLKIYDTHPEHEAVRLYIKAHRTATATVDFEF